MPFFVLLLAIWQGFAASPYRYYSDWAEAVEEQATDPSAVPLTPQESQQLEIPFQGEQAPIEWENIQRANMVEAASIAGRYGDSYKIFIGRDAELLYTSYVALEGSADSSLISLTRKNRNSNDLIRRYLLQEIQKVNGKPIVFIDTVSTGESFQDFILTNVPPANRDRVHFQSLAQPDPRAEQVARGKTSFPVIPESRSFFLNVTPERVDSKRLVPKDRTKKRGTAFLINKETPHGVYRSRDLVEREGRVDAETTPTPGSGSRTTENYIVDTPLALKVIADQSRYVQDHQEEAQRTRDLLQELDDSRAHSNPRDTISRLKAILQIHYGDTQVEALIRDLLESWEINRNYRITAHDLGIKGQFSPYDTRHKTEAGYPGLEEKSANQLALSLIGSLTKSRAEWSTPRLRQALLERATKTGEAIQEDSLVVSLTDPNEMVRNLSFVQLEKTPITSPLALKRLLQIALDTAQPLSLRSLALNLAWKNRDQHPTSFDEAARALQAAGAQALFDSLQVYRWNSEEHPLWVNGKRASRLTEENLLNTLEFNLLSEKGRGTAALETLNNGLVPRSPRDPKILSRLASLLEFSAFPEVQMDPARIKTMEGIIQYFESAMANVHDPEAIEAVGKALNNAVDSSEMPQTIKEAARRALRVMIHLPQCQDFFDKLT